MPYTHHIGGGPLAHAVVTTRNGWLFKQGHFIAASVHKYCTEVNGRGMRKASDFENALIFTGGRFGKYLEF